MNLESELRALAVEWPATPHFALAHRRRRRWPLAAAILAAAVAVAFAVPQSRGAILRFFHIGSATIRVVDRLPRAQERPLVSGLGPVVPRARVRTLVHLLVPPVTPAPALHRSAGNVISTVFRVDGTTAGPPPSCSGSGSPAGRSARPCSSWSCCTRSLSSRVLSTSSRKATGSLRARGHYATFTPGIVLGIAMSLCSLADGGFRVTCLMFESDRVRV